MSTMPKNIITHTGPNIYELEQALQKEKADFIAKHSSMAIENIDGEEAELSDIKQKIESRSLFEPQKLVIIRRISSNKQAPEQIENIIDAVAEMDKLIIVEPQLDKRGSLYKILKSKTELCEHKPLDDDSLAKWLVDTAKELGAIISPRDARYLTERAGGSQQSLHSELIKLSNYDKTITRTTIDDLVEASPTGTIFNLLEASFSGDSKRALELYESQRAQKVEPQQIMSMIVWQLHLVALVRAGKNKSADVIASEAGLKSFAITKASRIASKLSQTQLKELLHRLGVLDKTAKTESINLDEALKNFLLELA